MTNGILLPWHAAELGLNIFVITFPLRVINFVLPWLASPSFSHPDFPIFPSAHAVDICHYRLHTFVCLFALFECHTEPFFGIKSRPRPIITIMIMFHYFMGHLVTLFIPFSRLKSVLLPSSRLVLGESTRRRGHIKTFLATCRCRAEIVV